MTSQVIASRILLLGATVAIVLPLSGCVGVAVGAGATAGIAAAQEGGVKGAATDTAIRIQIADKWFKKDVEMFRHLSMTVKEGRVLITGSVPNPDTRVEAVRLAWQADGVRQVINEIRVDNGDSFKTYVTDSWVTSNLKSRILLDKYVQSINYTVETVGGVVYLMGVAQDQMELDRVINYARNTKYVKNVVSYVRLRGDLTPPSGPYKPIGSDAMPVEKSGSSKPVAESLTVDERNDIRTLPVEDSGAPVKLEPVTTETLR